MKKWSLHFALAASVLVNAACAQTPQIIHTEPSKFAPIVVYEQGGERCMKFGSVRAAGRQSCVALDRPDSLLFDYTRMMVGALYLKPDVSKVLIIGLGGGSLPTALRRILPDARVDTVEIDPAVLNVAQRYFGYRTDPRQQVHLDDGRAFVERALARGERYDLVMLDAFDETYIPPHLLTRQFISQVRSLLTPGGVLAANTFSSSRAYDDESATYAAVLGPFFNLKSANRVILARPDGLPPPDELQRNARRLDPLTAQLGVRSSELLPRFTTTRDWPDTARVLSD